MVGHGGGEQVAEEESWSGFWGGEGLGGLVNVGGGGGGRRGDLQG